MPGNRIPLFVFLLAEGSGSILFGIHTIQAVPLHQRAGHAWIFYFGAALIVLSCACLWHKPTFQTLDHVLGRVGGWLGVSAFQVLALVSSPLLALLASQAAGFEFKMYSPWLAVAGWTGGILLAAWGGSRTHKNQPHISRQTMLWVFGVVCLALITRGIGTAEVPIVLTGDESQAGLSAMKFATGEWNNIFITGWYSFPTLFTSLQAVGIQIWGHTIEALRLPAALIGALTVGAVYILGLTMFNHKVGAYAALFMTTFHFHVHFSRLGINNIWDGLWFTLVVAAVWHGWTHEKRSSYIVGGVTLGLAQYFYSSSRALIIILCLAMLWNGIHQRARLLRAMPHILVGIVCAIVVALPLTRYYLYRPEDFLAPYVRFSMLGEPGFFQNPTAWADLPKTFLLCLGAYAHTPLFHAWYAPETPILRPLAATLFYSGLLFLLFQKPDGRFGLILLWLIAFGAMASLSDFPPAPQRYVASAPVCALLVGYGLHSLSHVARRLQPRFQWLGPALCYAMLFTLMVSDLYFYFVTNVATERINKINHVDVAGRGLGLYLQDKPPGTRLFFLGTTARTYDSAASVRYLAPQVEGITVLQGWHISEHTEIETNRVIFVALPERYNELTNLAHQITACKMNVIQDWNLQVLLWVYDCTPNQINKN